MRQVFNIVISVLVLFIGFVGDLVYSYDTITGEVSQQEVTAVFVLESDHINYLTILDEQGREQVIETTDSHPFWVVTDKPDLSRAAREFVLENGTIIYHENIGSGLNGFWVESKDLREGDVFIGASGELSTLIAVERVVFPDGIKVYNFTVDGNHNYFVIAKCDEFGQTCILVHNAKCGPEFKYKTPDELSAITHANYHRDIKPSILKHASAIPEVKKDLNKMGGIKNPDIWLSPNGQIGLVHPTDSTKSVATPLMIRDYIRQ